MTSKEIEKIFKNVRKDNGGFIPCETLRNLRALVWANAISYEIESPESYDSTLKFEMEDGEELTLHNPWQRAFPCYVTLAC